MNEENNSLKRSLFYDVPPPSQNHRFYAELIEKGNFTWTQWQRGARYRGSQRHTRYYEITWPTFTLIGTSWHMVARVMWNKFQRNSHHLELWVYPESKEMPGNFRATFAFCLWNPENNRNMLMKHLTVDNFVTRKGHMEGFSNFIPINPNNMFPVQQLPLWDRYFKTNLTLYIRLEVSNSKIYRLQPPDWKISSLLEMEGDRYEMARYGDGDEYQDSEPFQCAGASWRLFFSPRPAKLLLQRLPGDSAGDIEVEFELLGWAKDGKFQRDYLEHTFEEGFNDWGMDNDFYKKCQVFAVSIKGEATGNRANVRPENDPTPLYGSFVNAGPPPGPPPTQVPEKSQATHTPAFGAPPPGPPPSQSEPGNQSTPSYQPPTASGVAGAAHESQDTSEAPPEYRPVA